MIDLTSACQRTAQVLANVTDDQLSESTPCEKLTVDELVAHVGGLALAFTAAARKDFGPLTDTPPTFGGALDDDWRTAYPQHLAELAAAFEDPAAWQGMSRAGGVDFPGEVAGMVALTEVVVHGWDLARATGQPYGIDAVRVLPRLRAGRVRAGGGAAHLHGLPPRRRPGRHAQLRRGARLGQLLVVGRRPRSPTISAQPGVLDELSRMSTASSRLPHKGGCGAHIGSRRSLHLPAHAGRRSSTTRTSPAT